MINPFSQLPSLNTPAFNFIGQIMYELTAPENIGFIVIAIIVSPVVVITIASIFSGPRKFRVPALFIGSVVLLVGTILAGFALISILLKFIIP